MMDSVHPPVTGHQIVLVVEDEVMIRELVCDVLESEGLEAVAKCDADQALAYLRDDASHVALIFTDINMPGSMDGAGLANYSRLAWPDIPVLAMSGMETCESAGITGSVSLIRKPFAMADMMSKVRTALAGRP